MHKITTCIVFALLMILSSCGQVSNQEADINLNPNPSDEQGEVVEDSSTIILDETADPIESGVQWWTDWEELSL